MIDGVAIEEEIKNSNNKQEVYISGFVSIVFIIVFLIASIAIDNWGIFILGAGLLCIGTSLVHMKLNLEKESDQIREYIIKIDDNVKMSEFCKKYKILEDMGHGLYRVINRSCEKVLEGDS